MFGFLYWLIQRTSLSKFVDAGVYLADAQGFGEQNASDSCKYKTGVA